MNEKPIADGDRTARLARTGVASLFVADAAPPVVADEARAYYRIDIASFATCIAGHVARADEALPNAASRLRSCLRACTCAPTRC